MRETRKKKKKNPKKTLCFTLLLPSLWLIKYLDILNQQNHLDIATLLLLHKGDH